MRLRHPHTIRDIEAQYRMVKSGAFAVVHDDHEELTAHIEQAVDGNDRRRTRASRPPQESDGRMI